MEGGSSGDGGEEVSLVCVSLVKRRERVNGLKINCERKVFLEFRWIMGCCFSLIGVIYSFLNVVIECGIKDLLNYVGTCHVCTW